MKRRALLYLATLIPTLAAAQEEHGPEEDLFRIRLDESGIQNLHIETVAAEERDFETTVFAIGRIEEIPSRHSVLSSRIPGRVLELNAFVGDQVEAGQILAIIESRQPGNPPPTIPLKAPQSGLVISSHVRIGEPVEPDRELLDISDRSTMWAVAKVPENAAAQVKPGSKARLRIPALGNEVIPVTMLRYGTSANRQSGTIEAIFELGNEERKLQPGMRAEFSLIISSRPSVLAIPREAVQGPPAKRVVFIEDFDLENVYARAPVVLGRQNDQYVEIISGLFPQDQVVTRGAYALSFTSGGRISLKEYLDASHGHEHNEDGSDMIGQQKAARTTEPRGEHHHAADHSHPPLYLRVYAGVITLLFIATAQLLWRARKKSGPDPAPVTP